MQVHKPLNDWFQSKQLCDFKSKFSSFLTKESLATTRDSYDGISYFIKGLSAEFLEADYPLALSFYEEGASQFDCFSLFRLFHISLGDKNFKTQYDEAKCLTYLSYSAVLESIDYKLGAWTLFQQYKKERDSQLKKLVEIIDNPIASFAFLPGIAVVIKSFYQFQLNSANFGQISTALNALTEKEKNISSFAMTSHLLDIMTTKLHLVQDEKLVRDFVTSLLMFHTEQAPFDTLYKNYCTMLKLVAVSKDHGKFFSHRLENMFWVWVFAFLNITKNLYLAELTPLISNFSHENVTFKWANTMSWIRSYQAYHTEKGLGCEADYDNALDQYVNEIGINPIAMYARIRRIIILKKQNQTKKVEFYIEEFNKIFEERMSQPGKIDSYLFYVKGKYFEKVVEDLDKALEWYQKGVDAPSICHKVQWFGNESWRMNCEKKRDKILMKKNGVLRGNQKWMED